MSYDITFKVKVEGTNTYIPVGDCDANITWNVRDIITKSTGLDWNNEENNGLCKDIVPKIMDGLNELQCNPDKYKELESPNGWGTIAGTIHFFWRIISAWQEFRQQWPELIDVATFWVE